MTDRDPLAALIEAGVREGRKSGLTLAAAADLTAQQVREQLEGDDGLSAPDRVDVQSVVSGSSGAPLVQCRVGSERWQWDPADARKHAAQVFEVAEAAEHDAVLVRWLTVSVGMSLQKAAASLQDLRQFRGDGTLRPDWRPEAGS